MDPFVFIGAHLQPQTLEAPFLGIEIFKGYIERNVVERRLVRVELERLAFQEITIGCIKEGQILGVTAISLCNLEEYKTIVSPQHFESQHFFVKLLHRVEVLDAD